MKILKVVLLASFLCTLLFGIECSAQTNPKPILPYSSPILATDGQQMTQQFQSVQGHDSSSFLLKAFYADSALGDYILNCVDNPNYSTCYIHVYLAANTWDSNSKMASDYSLVISGVRCDKNIDSFSNVDGALWQTTLAQAKCCVAEDGLDYSDRTTSQGCNITLAQPGIIDTTMFPAIRAKLQNYQHRNDSPTPPTNLVTESFLMSVSDFQGYLLSGQPGDTVNGDRTKNPVQYLQFYLGKNTTNYADQYDFMDLVLTGVKIDDNNPGLGNHVYSLNRSGFLFRRQYVFDEGLPCPTCNINKGTIDVRQQFIGSKYKSQKSTDKGQKTMKMKQK